MRRPPPFPALLLAALALPAAGCGGESPAGAESEIAFVTSRDGDYAIYGMRADGSGEGRLSTEPKATSTQDAGAGVLPGRAGVVSGRQADRVRQPS